MSLSRISDICDACNYKKDCDSKRMMSCAYLDKPNLLCSLTNDVSQPLMQDLAVKHDYRNIKIDKDTTVTIDLEEMKRKLIDDINNQLHCGLNFGA